MLRTLDSALYTRFRRGLQRRPEQDAVRVEGRAVTYREAHEAALIWAGSLCNGLSGPPSTIGVLADKGPDAYVGLLAALYAGAAVVPLHPAFPAARTRQMLQAARVSAVVADAAGVGVLQAAGVDVPVLAPHVSGDVGPLPRVALDPAAGLEEPLPVQPSDTAYILFTSGSTGRPKGVPISHASTAHYFALMDARYGFTADDVFSQTFDLNFDCAMFDLFCAWGNGATVQVIGPGAYRSLPGFAADTGLSVWFSTPSAIALARRLGVLAPGMLPGLRWSLFAGEALLAHDAVTWQACADRSTVENIYGPTELTVTISGHRWDPRTSPGLCVNGLVPIGAVHVGHDWLLLDAHGAPTPDQGELCITGPQMTRGYLDPADDKGRFLHHDGRTWYRTGDRVRRLGDGELIYLGRLDAQVQVQGWRVELAEVDHALRGCPGVEDAATVARSSDKGTELVAFYTGTPSAPAQLARRLGRTLPAGMIPRHYEWLDAFPLNANRKVDRGRLTGMATTMTGAGQGVS